MNLFELNHVSKRYGDFYLQDITFSLPAGGIMGLVGENGAGKSTVIKLILDMVRPDSGSISVLGKSNQVDFDKTKQDIGVVLDEACFPDFFTGNHINRIMQDAYRNWEESVFFHHLHRFSLPKDEPFKSFSRGMRMKLNIAVALSHHAKLLLLDEATSGLDPIIRDEILELLYDFVSDETHGVLLSSHIVSDLEKICDYLTVLHRGRLVLSQEKDRLLEQYGHIKCSQTELKALPPNAIAYVCTGSFGAQALVIREKMPSDFPMEKPGIEDLLLLMAKGESQQ